MTTKLYLNKGGFVKIVFFRSFVLIYFSALLLCACASKKISVTQAQAEKLDALQDGRTTTDEVRVIFGIPDAALTKGKNRTWVYRDKSDTKKQTYRLPKGFHGQGIILYFDSQGILKNHREASAEDIKALDKQVVQETSRTDVVIDVNKEDRVYPN